MNHNFKNEILPYFRVATVMNGEFAHFPSFTSAPFTPFNAVVRWHFLMGPPTLERFHLFSLYWNIINLHCKKWCFFCFIESNWISVRIFLEWFIRKVRIWHLLWSTKFVIQIKSYYLSSYFINNLVLNSNINFNKYFNFSLLCSLNSEGKTDNITFPNHEEEIFHT